MLRKKREVPAGRRDDWETPQWLFDRLDREFRFELDAAAQPHNTKCERFLDDALEQEWDADRIWCNPPYGQMLFPFLERAVDRARRGGLVVCLIPARTETDWWHELVIPHAAEIRFIRGRVAFKPPPGHELSEKGNRPVHNSAIVIFSGTDTRCAVTSMIGRRNSALLNNGQRELEF